MSCTLLAFTSKPRPLSSLAAGRARPCRGVSEPRPPDARERLLALGVTAGAHRHVLQTFPGIVFECDQTELAVERGGRRRHSRPADGGSAMTPSLRLVFWETTKACNLTCRHCRAVPQKTLGPTELTTRRAFDLIDQIAQVAKPVMVLSGGEPLFRPDLFDIGAYGVETGFRMALATNGTLVDERVAAQIADTGFSRVAISLDGAEPETHDKFRGLPGSHALALRGLRNLRDEGSRSRSTRRSRSTTCLRPTNQR